MDGITLGRPTCSVPHCTIPLANKRAKVAHPKHGEALDLPVAHIIKRDDDLASDETYEIIGDRVVPSEEEAITQTTLARASLNATVPIGNVPLQAPSTKKKICAQFGRSRTHNEQILVAPCGIIIARETFYHAESITAVVVCANILPLSKN